MRSGAGVTAAESFGSKVHDAIHYAKEDIGKPTRFTREQNNAGGVEGGVSNGEDIVVRGYLKPISTLRQVRWNRFALTRARLPAQVMSAAIFAWCPRPEWPPKRWSRLTIAGLAQEKFGGDSAAEMKRNFEGYIEQIRSY